MMRLELDQHQTESMTFHPSTTEQQKYRFEKLVIDYTPAPRFFFASTSHTPSCKNKEMRAILNMMTKVRRWPNIIQMEIYHCYQDFKQSGKKSIFDIIQVISFPHLSVLKLEGCCIYSIDNMRFQAPTLTFLSLSNNLITSIRPLYRWWFPSLQNLHLENNPVTESSPILVLHSPSLQQLVIQHCPEPSPSQYMDMVWGWPKLETRSQMLICTLWDIAVEIGDSVLQLMSEQAKDCFNRRFMKPIWAL